MKLAKRIRIKPNKEQETQFLEFCNTARFAYNESLAFHNRKYREDGSYATIQECIKHLQDLKYNNPKYSFLLAVPEAVTKQAIKDLDKAFRNFFSYKDKGFELPNFKKRNRCKKSFYQRTDNFRQVDETHIKITGIKTPVKIKRCSIPEKVLNTRISFDGKYWYLSFSVETEIEKVGLTGETIGIDLGIKELATVSDGTVYHNINKTDAVRKTEKRKRRLQRQLSRKYQANKQGSKFVKTKNILKLEQEIRLIDRCLKNIRNTYIHETTKALVRTKPSTIVLEDLNVKRMMKNKYLSKAVQQQEFRKFRAYLEYKCIIYGIKVQVANTWYPSSKTCSCCGNVKKQLKISERIYKCDSCGFELDRDLNAAINLSRYPLIGKKRTDT